MSHSLIPRLVPRLVPVFLASFLSMSSVAFAQQWVPVHPGVELHETEVPGPNRVSVLRVSLCTPGLSIGATAYEDRGRTTSSWAWSQSAKAAINGGFFGAGFSSDGGAAAGAGAEWPSSTDTGYRGWLAFGPGQLQHSPAHLVEALPGWTTDAVNGDATLVDGGNAVNCGGCGSNARHPRTAVGFTADRRTLFLVTVDGRSAQSRGMTIDELSIFMASLGVDRAMNLDGGGSSTMYVRGIGVINTPSDGSERAVGNHLGVFVDENSSSRPNCVDTPPRGWLDQASCTVSGWAQDIDAPDAAVDVELTLDDDGETFVVSADRHRDDLCTAIGSCPHGYVWDVPAAYRDGEPHLVRASAINIGDTAAATELAGSPQTLTCAPPPEPVIDAGGEVEHPIADAGEEAEPIDVDGGITGPIDLGRLPDAGDAFAIDGGKRDAGSDADIAIDAGTNSDAGDDVHDGAEPDAAAEPAAAPETLAEPEATMETTGPRVADGCSQATATPSIPILFGVLGGLLVWRRRRIRRGA